MNGTGDLLTSVGVGYRGDIELLGGPPEQHAMGDRHQPALLHVVARQENHPVPGPAELKAVKGSLPNRRVRNDKCLSLLSSTSPHWPTRGLPQRPTEPRCNLLRVGIVPRLVHLQRE